MKRFILINAIIALTLCWTATNSYSQIDPSVWEQRIAELPTSKFGDTPLEKITLQQQDKDWAEKVRIYNSFVKEKGQYYALGQLKDGSNYFNIAQEKVSFLKPKRKTLILYTCWDQARLENNTVTLEKLDAKEAVIHLKPMHLQIHEKAEWKDQISADDLKKMFETIWQTRAMLADWDLAIKHEADKCTLSFTKSKVPLRRKNVNATMDELAADLDCPDLEIRNLTINRLGRKRSTVATEPLIKALKTDKNIMIRKNAAFALAKIADPKATDALIEALKDEAPKVRGNAAYALNKINANRAIKPLIDALAREKDVDTITAIADALMTITTETIGTEPEVWQKWWEENKDKYEQK